MRARDRLPLVALLLGSSVPACVLDARLGALDGDDGTSLGSGGSASDDATSDGATGSDPGAVPPGLEPGADPPVILDCNVEGGYEVSSWRAIEPSSPRLWVAGVYATVEHPFGEHPQGAGTISWAIPGDNVLVVGSYEAADWTVTVAAGGSLSKVVATGYYPQTVQAPEGVTVELYAYEEGSDWACGYSLPGQGGGCEGEELVAFAQQVTGLPLHGFDGCYEAATFEYLP